MDYELELHLYISDPNTQPEEISKIVGISPDKTSRRGERISEPPMPKTNVWRLSSPESSANSSLREQWDGLLGKLRPQEKSLSALPKTAKTQLTLALYAHEFFPTLDFPIDTMRQIAEFGVPLELSIYDLIGDEEKTDER